jgi:hypothetical protein
MTGAERANFGAELQSAHLDCAGQRARKITLRSMHRNPVAPETRKVRESRSLAVIHWRRGK